MSCDGHVVGTARLGACRSYSWHRHTPYIVLVPKGLHAVGQIRACLRACAFLCGDGRGGGGVPLGMRRWGHDIVMDGRADLRAGLGEAHEALLSELCCWPPVTAKSQLTHLCA